MPCQQSRTLRSLNNFKTSYVANPPYLNCWQPTEYCECYFVPFICFPITYTLPLKALAPRIRVLNVRAAASIFWVWFFSLYVFGRRLNYAGTHSIHAPRRTPHYATIHHPYLHPQTLDPKSQLKSTVLNSLQTVTASSLVTPLVVQNYFACSCWYFYMSFQDGSKAENCSHNFAKPLPND